MSARARRIGAPHFIKMKYPIILVHGVALREGRAFKAFGNIGKVLKKTGFRVYTANTDGFGTIENNAEQLKAYIRTVLEKEQCEKVNLVAHSKGGLDSKYMLLRLGMNDKVASLTTLSTPHGGAKIASWIYGLPTWFKRFLAFWINLWYRIFGDKKPDALAVCAQLCASPNETLDSLSEIPDSVYCQSYSATMARGRDDFLMGIPHTFTKRRENSPIDGLVSVESSKYGDYRGDILEESVSHTEMVGYSLSKKKRERIYAFWLSLCAELSKKGF